MITTRLVIQPDDLALSPELSSEVLSIENHFSKVSKTEVLRYKSRALKDALSSYTPKAMQSPGNSINPESQGKLPANLRLDSVLCSSDKRYYLNIELCFNNRESAGTNYLKLESAAAFQKESGAVDSLGLLLVPKRELLDMGGWDSSYGDSSEYSFYFKEVFQKSLIGKFLILELSGSFLN